MSIYGDALRTLPFLVIRIEDSYSDENGYSTWRTYHIDTLFGSFEINPNFSVRRLVRTLRNKDSRKYWRYSGPVTYTRPDLRVSFSGDAETIRDAIAQEREQAKKRAWLQKLTVEKQDAYLTERRAASFEEARAMYVRILDDVKRPKDARRLEAGQYVSGCGEAEIQKLADEHMISEERSLRYVPKQTHK